MEKEELKELVSIKKLLILLLIKSGVPTDTISKALNIHPSRISQILSVRKIKGLRVVRRKKFLTERRK